jgi:hypothetical protein
MVYLQDIQSIEVRGLNVKAAAGGWALQLFEFELYFKCIKLSGVSMPGSGNINRQCL